MKKLLAGLLVLVLMAWIGWRIFDELRGARELQRPRGPRAVAVQVEPVRRQTMSDIAEFTGTLAPSSRFVLAPKVQGRLEKLLVNIGDTVKKGDLVAVLDSEEYVQKVAQARAELEVAQANLIEAQSTLEVASREAQRIRELFKRKVISASEQDAKEAAARAAQAQRDVAEAQIRQKEAALKAAEVQLSYTRIKAAWEDGDDARLVAERFVDEGALLKANDPIVSIVDNRMVIALIFAIERDYPQLQVGQEAVAATDAFPGREFPGRIARRAPVLKEDSRQARLEVEIPNPDLTLAPGMFVRVRIRSATHEDAQVVPVTALVRRNDRQGIFLADTEGQTCTFVPVTLGIVNDPWAEVIDPPLSGLVVTLGHHLLVDGAAILLPGSAPEGKKRKTADPGGAPPQPARQGGNS